jgi:hypothetical protein
MSELETFTLERNKYMNVSYLNINGYNVLGNPYYGYKWLEGYLETMDGRKFGPVSLRYELYHQQIQLLNRKDSLTVTDEIKEFTLKLPMGGSVTEKKFINSNLVKKDKKVFYYEVLADDKKGQLLKTNKLTMEHHAPGIPSSEGIRRFAFHEQYYFFNKDSGKLFKISSGGSNITSILNLDQIMQKQLKLKSYDFNIESALVNFFNAYFNLVNNYKI